MLRGVARRQTAERRTAGCWLRAAARGAEGAGEGEGRAERGRGLILAAVAVAVAAATPRQHSLRALPLLN